jgi:hypothetical protein
MPNEIQFDCPFCKTNGAGFKILFDKKSPRGDYIWNSIGSCGVCKEFVMFVFETPNSGTGPAEDSLLRFDTDAFEVLETFPAHNGPRVTEATPDNVLKPYVEAERSFEMGLYSAAGSCYRKAMERAVKHINPDTTGMLNARIRELEERQIIPHSMIELLDQIRLFGNASMHEEDDDPTFQDCDAAREFAYLFLRYAFTLPALVAEAKAKQEN